MSESTLFMRQRPIAQPEAKLPAMLNRPISDSAQAPTDGGKPQSATTPGRCVAMNATWKPQTKKPAVSSRKLGSFHASRTACFIDFSGAAPCAAGACFPRKTKASGTMASESRPSDVSAPTQPSAPVSAIASGATTNWPNEPPALTMPLAMPRFSGGSARATADISTPSPAMPPPPAATTPIRRTSIQVLVAYGVSTVPSMTSTAPVAITRPVPYLSATAPAIGCVMPHMSCAQAKARLMAAMPKPVAELIGPMNSATDWRTPKMRANTRPAAATMARWRRVIGRQLQRWRWRLSWAWRFPLLHDDSHIHAPKKSSGRIAGERPRGLADGLGELRIGHRAREHQRTDQGREDAHRLLVRGALAPLGVLALDQPDQVLDAPADGAAHLLVLARHFAAGGGDGAAQALLGRVDVLVREIRVDERHQLLARLRQGDGARQALDRLGARLLGGVRQQLVARGEVRIEAAMREPRFLHDVGDADAFVAVAADGTRRRAQDALASLLLLGARLDRPHMTCIIF